MYFLAQSFINEFRSILVRSPSRELVRNERTLFHWVRLPTRFLNLKKI